MSFRLVYVGAASLLCLVASTPPAAEPTRRESAIAAAAAQGRLEELRPLLEGEKDSRDFPVGGWSLSSVLDRLPVPRTIRV